MHKSKCGIIFVIALCLGSINAYGNEDVLIRNTLQTFFSVLRSGNTTAIASYIGGDLHKRRQTLLRNNREYSQFLRRYYQGTEFQIERITEGSNEATAGVKLIFPDGKSEQFLLRIAREQGRGAWKIVEDIEQP